jgi:DnaJ-class molecular chaperone
MRPSAEFFFFHTGVDPEDDQKAIKRVFRKLSIELHPDKVGHDAEKLHRFNEVSIRMY